MQSGYQLAQGINHLLIDRLFLWHFICSVYFCKVNIYIHCSCNLLHVSMCVKYMKVIYVPCQKVMNKLNLWRGFTIPLGSQQ